ncbi:MAG: hypothetical protein HY402_07275 [Elusimicrobia bacterium]|nr:hypothetical protein [Elusimicrobiota bacterium]
MEVRASSKGQILVPALFILPTLVLFVYLVFETAKISREKIRHQFALDTAVFAEIANYSDLANRLAYINGPFPQRVFCEVLAKIKVGKTGSEVSVYDLFYQNGAFPQVEGANAFTCDNAPVGRTWNIRFSEEARSGINAAGPAIPPLELLTDDDANKNLIPYNGRFFPDGTCNKDEGIACPLFFLYTQIYQLLGEVADGQIQVFERLTSDHAFYKRAYWLNTGLNVLALLGSMDFPSLSPRMHFVDSINFAGVQLDRDVFQPFHIVGPEGGNALFNEETGNQSEVFQLATVPELASGSPFRFEVQEVWEAPSVYFPVDLNSLARARLGEKLFVHTGVRLSGGQVWPDPTPKYQVQLLP